MKYSPGPGACYLKGSVGQYTFRRTRYGSIVTLKMKRWRIPSAEFLRRKALVSAVAYAWAGVLTAGERIAWATYSATHPIKNECGTMLWGSGYTWFQKYNLPRVGSGLPIALIPPT